jgi:tetratricopeptide (TPR) repeat protein
MNHRSFEPPHEDPDGLPSSAQDPLEVARARRERGDLAGAEAAAREALARAPDDPAALLELAAVLADLDRFDAALRVIDRAAPRAPDDETAERLERLRADIFGRSGRIDAALATLRALVERRPQSREAWLDLALGLVAAAEPDEADLAIARALERLPNDPELWAARASVAAARGRPRDSVLYLTRALARADETIPPARRVILKTNLASALDMAGETEKALATWRSIIAEHADAGDAYLQLGIALWRRERYAEAAAVLADAVARWPREHHGYYYLADSRRMLGDRAEAERVFEQAIARWPECPECLFGLAQVRHESGRPEEAALLLRHVLALRPDDPDTIGLFADARFAIGEHEEARRLFEMAMTLAPGEVRHVYNFAIREREAGRLDRATALFDRALELAPHLDRALYFGAVCRLERGLRKEAMDYLARFVRAAPLSAPIVRADPHFDALKEEEAYRALVGGSALDFAAPQAARPRLERLLAGIPCAADEAAVAGRPLAEALDCALAAAIRAKESRGPVRLPPRFYFETEVRGPAVLIAERDAFAPPEATRRLIAVLVRLPDGSFRVEAA